jgi:formylglycine-generating enzyme required for sulfatase activity
VVTTQANCTGIWIEAVFCNPSPCPTTDGLVLIPAGTFAMGSPTDEPGREDFETQHQVTLTKPFYVCDHEVTQSEWETVMHWNDSHFRGADLPIATVTWFDAIDYCNRRSIGDSLAPAYTLSGIKRIGAHLIDATVVWDQGANGYRLPTEAEWEYACRAGSATAFCNGPITQVARDCGDDPGLDLVGCYCGNASETTHAVGGKAANAWGLYDMHGNVWEWCWDWSGSYGGDAVDPSGPAAASDRVRRGGSSFSYAQYCRSAGRGNYSPGFGHFNLGFRLSRTAR